MNYTYIKFDIAKTYVTFSEPFDENLYNNIGTTWEDYLDNKWVLLSPEQVAFHEEHPEASVRSVWTMTLPPVPERTLEQAKAEKINEIDAYDNSSSVNNFIVRVPSESEEAIDGYIDYDEWFTPDERSNYRSSIASAKLLSVENIPFYIGDMPVTLPTSTAEVMLAQIQLYADSCFIVTKQHKAAVEALDTIEAVDAYTYDTGYPEMLIFTLPTLS